MGASKGSPFERWLCVQLSLWWTQDDRSEDGPSDAVFWRTSTSGGRATTRSKKGKKTKNHYGDITAVDPIGQPFIDFVTIEAKRGYNRASLSDLLDKPQGAVSQAYENWIAQAEKSAKGAGSFGWLLILKRDRRDSVVFMPKVVSDALESKWRPGPTVRFFPSSDRGLSEPIVGMPLGTFLHSVHPDTIKRLVKRIKRYGT